MDLKKLYSNIRPIIKGKVGNKDAYFLLDTGSNLAVLDSSQTKEYQLQWDKQFPGNVIGLTGDSIPTYYCTSIVTIGDKILDGFILSDLSSIRNSIQRETDINILGIISYPQMKELGIVLNPSKNEINGI